MPQLKDILLKLLFERFFNYLEYYIPFIQG